MSSKVRYGFIVLSFQEVVWPTITVCNLNQIEASFLKDLGVYGNVELTNVLKNEFVLGRQGKLSPEHENLVNQIKDFVGPNRTFSNWSRQKCKDLFINVSFRNYPLCPVLPNHPVAYYLFFRLP